MLVYLKDPRLARLVRRVGISYFPGGCIEPKIKPSSITARVNDRTCDCPCHKLHKHNFDVGLTPLRWNNRIQAL